jgi:hypothetical protein
MERNEQQAKKRRLYFTRMLCIWLFSPNKLEIIYPRGLKCMRALHPGCRVNVLCSSLIHHALPAERRGNIYILFISVFFSNRSNLLCTSAFFPPVSGGEVRHIVSISVENGKEGAGVHGRHGVMRWCNFVARQVLIMCAARLKFAKLPLRKKFEMNLRRLLAQ